MVEHLEFPKARGGGGVKMFLPPVMGYGCFLEYFMEDTPGGL